MKNALLKLTKTLLINILIFLTLIFFIEIFFGYWFDQDNLGSYMREHRMKKTLYELKSDEKIYKHIYKRNYYGFRGEEINLNEIRAILVGGSTADERYKPEEFTIVGFLNKKFEEKGSKLKIINAGIEGQSTMGHISNFKHWFPKLKNFSPDYIIFYIGINDALKNIENKNNIETDDGWLLNPNIFDSIKDNIKSRSLILDSIRKIKHKYYKGNEKKRIIYDFDYMIKNKSSDFEYQNFDEKLKYYDLEKILDENKKRIKYYLANVDKLFKYSKKIGAKPVFINQEAGRKDITEKLFALNVSLINHCKKNSYNCINLAKKLNGNPKYWWDGIHTTATGSKNISEIIFSQLESIIR